MFVKYILEEFGQDVAMDALEKRLFVRCIVGWIKGFQFERAIGNCISLGDGRTINFEGLSNQALLRYFRVIFCKVRPLRDSGPIRCVLNGNLGDGISKGTCI